MLTLFFCLVHCHAQNQMTPNPTIKEGVRRALLVGVARYGNEKVVCQVNQNYHRFLWFLSKGVLIKNKKIF